MPGDELIFCAFVGGKGGPASGKAGCSISLCGVRQKPTAKFLRNLQQNQENADAVLLFKGASCSEEKLP